jgi:hypothetical protein
MASTADPGVTQAIYAHRMTGSDHLAAEAIGRLFDGSTGAGAADGEKARAQR